MTNLLQLPSKNSLHSSLHRHSHCYTLPQVQTIHSSLSAKDYGYCHSFHELPTKPTKHSTARTTFLEDWCHQVSTLVKCLQWLCTHYGIKSKLLILIFWLLRMSILPLTLISQFPSLSPKHSMPILISTVLSLMPYSPSLPGKQIQPPTHMLPYLVYAFDFSYVSNKPVSPRALNIRPKKKAQNRITFKQRPTLLAINSL